MVVSTSLHKMVISHYTVTSTSTCRLADCRVTTEWVEHLAFALKSSYSALRDLDLSNNDLNDSGVELLGSGLSNQCCQLETLRYLHRYAHSVIRW